MHIVVVDSTITTPPTGGAHTFVVELTCALVRRGAQVSLVTQPGPERSLVSAMRGAGVDLVSVSPDAGWLALPLLDARAATVAVVHSDGPAFYEPLRHYQSFID